MSMTISAAANEWRRGRRMRRKLLVISVMAVLVVALVVPIAAQAGWMYRWSGDTANAQFNQTDGDVYTSIYVDASRGRYQSPPGNGDSFSNVFLYVYRWDMATDTGTNAWGWKELGPGEFTMKSLKSAALSTTVPMFDVFGNEFSVDADVDWIGTGPTIRSSYIYKYLYPGMHLIDSGADRRRAATADGDFTVDLGWELSRPADSGMLTSGRNRSMSIN